MLSAIGCGCLAAGATLVVVVGGLWARDALARRRPSDVFDYIEPPRRLRFAPLRCICPARLGECACAVDGVRNPRGAGRARIQPLGPAIDEVRSARIVACPGRCRHPSQCSTPAVCRAVAAMNSKSNTNGG